MYALYKINSVMSWQMVIIIVVVVVVVVVLNWCVFV